MTFSVAICTQCGEPFDATSYSLCSDCKYDRRFIKLRKQHEVSTEDKEGQRSKDEESV
jgi:NMD protein affecting ribosome stability and mRNA decay